MSRARIADEVNLALALLEPFLAHEDRSVGDHRLTASNDVYDVEGLSGEHEDVSIGAMLETPFARQLERGRGIRGHERERNVERHSLFSDEAAPLVEEDGRRR